VGELGRGGLKYEIQLVKDRPDPLRLVVELLGPLFSCTSQLNSKKNLYVATTMITVSAPFNGSSHFSSSPLRRPSSAHSLFFVAEPPSFEGPDYFGQQELEPPPPDCLAISGRLISYEDFDVQPL
jgi:hypothetical protein